MSLFKLDARREGLDARTENTKNEIENAVSEGRAQIRRKWFSGLKIIGGMFLLCFLFSFWRLDYLNAVGDMVINGVVRGAAMVFIGAVIALISYVSYKKWKAAFIVTILVLMIFTVFSTLREEKEKQIKIREKLENLESR